MQNPKHLFDYGHKDRLLLRVRRRTDGDGLRPMVDDHNPNPIFGYWHKDTPCMLRRTIFGVLSMTAQKDKLGFAGDPLGGPRRRAASSFP